MNKADFEKKPPEDLNVLTVINHSHIPQNVAKTIEYTTSSSESWNLGFGVSLGTTITLLKVETKIPLSGTGHKQLLKICFEIVV